MAFGNPQDGVLKAILDIILERGVEEEHDTDTIAKALVTASHWGPKPPPHYERQVNRSFSQNTDAIFERTSPGTYRLRDDYELPHGKRLPAADLRSVKSNHIWKAIQSLQAGSVKGDFGASTNYDVLLEDGTRLPPKAVFGLAATDALGFEVLPKHFSGHEGSIPFAAIREAGYQVVPKGAAGSTPGDPEAPPAPPEEVAWAEGNPYRVSHLKRERAAGLAPAKKAAFQEQHGKLSCEQCGLDPVKHYGEHGDACIEVHHTKPVSQMQKGEKTGLGDLQCLCANCHRLVHRLLKLGEHPQS